MRRSITESVTDYLQDHPKPALARVELYADAHATTPPTVRRKLSIEGTSWRQIKDQVIKARADEMLEKKDAPEVAQDLGYTGANAFYRAFIRLHGVNITAFREASI